MKIDQYLDVNELTEHITDGYVDERKHPTLPLTILCYSRKTVYEDRWTDVAKKCRGLIVADDGTVVSRPFEKFFNLDTLSRSETHLHNLPTTQPQVLEKLDGCFLGDARVNLWDGGTISIREIVNGKLKPKLVGFNVKGEAIPCEVLDWFNNGTKDHWIYLDVDCNISLKSGVGKYKNRLVVTPNHHVYSNGSFIPAIKVKVGDCMRTQEIVPDAAVMHYIQSSLLGDGSVCKASNAYRFSESHKVGHAELNQFAKSCLGECSIGDRKIISGYGTEVTQVCSKSYKSLRYLRELWYPDGKKIIPNNLAWIDDFTVAKWYMDDGSLSHSPLQKDRANFATNGFTESDVIRLAGRLKEMYDVDAVVYESKGWCIRVNVGRDNKINNLWKSIAPYIVPCMDYKLPEEYRKGIKIPSVYGKELRIGCNAKVLGCGKMEDSSNRFCSGKGGFDIKTSVDNYMVNGVSVHNSLGILYEYKISDDITADPYVGVASKGSFMSEHAIWATNWYRKTCKNHQWPKGYTPIMEMICQEVQRHVVFYDIPDQLILLALINTETGEEADYNTIYHYAFLNGLKTAEIFLKSVGDVLTEDRENKEGYVLSWAQTGKPPLKVKVKHETFLKLQKIVHSATPKAILEALADKQFELIDTWKRSASPELADFVERWSNSLCEAYGRILTKAKSIKDNGIMRYHDNRKEIAAFFLLPGNKQYSKICFTMLDDKDPSKPAWALVEQEFKDELTRPVMGDPYDDQDEVKTEEAVCPS